MNLRLAQTICLLAVLLRLGAAAGLGAQADNAEKPAPVPYSAEEFPLFWRDVRRFEVILIGSIPITLLLTSLLYDIIYSAADAQTNTLVSATNNEQVFAKIGISISISAILAIIDMGIHLGKRNKRRKASEKLYRSSEFIRGPTVPETVPEAVPEAVPETIPETIPKGEPAEAVQ